MPVRIENLADHPTLVPCIAGWFFEEWGGRSPNDSLEAFAERLLGRINRGKPPLTLVAYKDEEPVGSAVLKIQEMDTHPQYHYWLGSVYVQENWRNLGIGSTLVKALIREAEWFEIQELYLCTHGSEGFYGQLGWEEIERTVFRSRIVTIMKRDILDRT